ncbi:MAG: hypothetical protein M3Q68_05610, partial [Actinomycetota bacterium]|nr:hypothetical protein [Actinomycetota bacterium]
PVGCPVVASSRRFRWLASVALVLAACGGIAADAELRAQSQGSTSTARVEATTTTSTAVPPPPPAETTTVPPPPETTTTPPPAPTTTEAPVRAASAAPAAPPATAPRARVPLQQPTRVVGDIAPYAGIGTWVDVYDWSHYKGTNPTVGPDQVDAMAAEGVQTLFIQTAKHDTPDLISERELLEPIIARAHQRGLRVVAWYLPTLEDVENDLNRLVASANLDVDGVAVDIESRKVADHVERSARLIDLSRRLRQALPGRAIGAIVMPPVQLEVVNPAFWPEFPYREIAASYDVWQTMGYWTDRKPSSGYRDPFTYTDENIRRLRNNLGNPTAAVSPVGGVGAMGNGDIESFLRAAVQNGAIGGSIYDWRTTRAEAWPALRGFRTT